MLVAAKALGVDKMPQKVYHQKRREAWGMHTFRGRGRGQRNL